MTTRLVSPVETYAFASSDRLFFDANVWLSIEPPQYANPRNEDAIYSRAFRRILQAGSKVFVDAIVLSEIANRWLRYSFDANKSLATSFKAFRGSSPGKAAAKDVAGACRRILKSANTLDTGLDVAKAGSVLSDLEAGLRDFNDALIAENCRALGLTLVTHDADFRGSGTRVLTANPRLLKP